MGEFDFTKVIERRDLSGCSPACFRMSFKWAWGNPEVSQLVFIKNGFNLRKTELSLFSRIEITMNVECIVCLSFTFESLDFRQLNIEPPCLQISLT